MTNSANTLNTGGGTQPLWWFQLPIRQITWRSPATTPRAQNCFYGINGVAQACTIAKYDPLRGDPFFELDMRLAKNFKFRERYNLQIVAQAFNLTNRANYGNDFGLNIGDPSTFGHPIGFINPTSTVNASFRLG